VNVNPPDKEHIYINSRSCELKKCFKRLNEISLNEKMFHLTNSAFVDLEVIDPESNSSPSRTIGTDSSENGLTAKNNGSLQLAEEYSARE